MGAGCSCAKCQGLGEGSMILGQPTLDSAGGTMRRIAERTAPLSPAGGPCPQRALAARPNVPDTGAASKVDLPEAAACPSQGCGCLGCRPAACSTIWWSNTTSFSLVLNEWRIEMTRAFLNFPYMQTGDLK